MARFFGTVQGNRGQATRLGHSHLQVTAQSWSGDVTVHLSKVMDEDYVCINVREHGGDPSPGRSKQLYYGPISRLLDQSRRKTMLQALAVDELVEG